jgi:nucleoside-diphosphate-sugar epimerase
MAVKRSRSTMQPELLILGAGHLGSRVAALWPDASPHSSVLAETLSLRRHEELREAGATPRLREEEAPEPVDHVLLCIPPSSTGDGVAEAERAVRLWNGHGKLVMTSSAAVYAEEHGGEVTEHSALARTTRARPLLRMEEPILAAGGIVIRLAGLYDAERGPHHYYLKRGATSQRPDGLVNLIHYEDAARLCECALLRGEPGAVYLGSDDHPLSRQELLDATLESGRFEAGAPGKASRVFRGTTGSLGKRLVSTWTREELEWQPVHRSFLEWVSGGASP